MRMRMIFVSFEEQDWSPLASFLFSSSYLALLSSFMHSGFRFEDHFFVLMALFLSVFSLSVFPFQLIVQSLMHSRKKPI